MTKQQLTRLFIVIAAIAAIVFVPYWVARGFIIPTLSPYDEGVPVFLVWLLGASSMSAIIVALYLITVLVKAIIIDLIINYIKNGK